MTKFIAFFIVFLCGKDVIAQNISLKENLFKINVLTPGFSFEKKISQNKSINFDANLSIGFVIKNNNTSGSNSDFNILTSPFLRSQYRYYYNLQRRVTKGRSITNNSGSFLALNSSYYFNPINNENYVSNYDGLTFGGIWGFQKTYKSKINISSNIGLGYNLSSSNDSSERIVPILNFTLGWVIGR